MSKGSNNTRSGTSSSQRATSVSTGMNIAGWKVDVGDYRTTFHSNIPMTYYNISQLASNFGLQVSQRTDSTGSYYDFSGRNGEIKTSGLKEFAKDALKLGKSDKERMDFMEKTKNDRPTPEWEAKMKKLTDRSKQLSETLHNKYK